MSGFVRDPLLERNAEQLARFGYVPAASGSADEQPDWAGWWRRLRADFATVHLAHVPDYGELSPWPQEAARIYMRRRLAADRLFEECRKLHGELLECGINTERVEAYSLARDAFEDSVHQFGEAREKLEKILAAQVDVRQGR